MAGQRDSETAGKRERTKVIRRHTDLEVYERAFDVAMTIFEATKKFPKEETYALTDQIRRSSRGVCANIAEAWRKRRYKLSFISKLIDAEARQPNRRHGFSSPLSALISHAPTQQTCIKSTMMLSEC